MTARRGLGIVAAALGALLLLLHLLLHPIPVSGDELQHDPPAPGRVVLTTDEAHVGETREDGILVVAIDQFSANAILVRPPFDAGAPFTSGRVHVFEAHWPAQARFEEHVYTSFDASAEYTLLANVVWDATRAQAMPPVWLPALGVTLLGASLLAIRSAHAWTGLAAFLGFVASHAAGATGHLGLLLAVWFGGWLLGVAGLALAAGAWARPAWRGSLPWAAAFVAFCAAGLLERALLAGYRPYTGIY